MEEGEEAAWGRKDEGENIVLWYLSGCWRTAACLLVELGLAEMGTGWSRLHGRESWGSPNFVLCAYASFWCFNGLGSLH